MADEIEFNSELIKRYDRSGPRYTSYPTANQFSTGVGAADYINRAKQTNEYPIPKPLSVYIHIPFCNTICYYCGCNKVVTKKHQRAQPYLEDLYKEIELQAELFDSDRVVEQIHLGGGTPTFLNRQELKDLLVKLGQHFQLRYDDGGEYSIEIDPRTVDATRIRELREMGFNRISLGVQDFDDDVQKAVNRIQPVEQTRAVLDAARDVHFKSINIDLIYGLPLQTKASFSRTLDTLIDISPNRIALYNYAHLPSRFPPQRRINEGDLPAPDEKLEIMEMAVNRLTEAGYVYIGMDHFAKPLDELAVAQRNGSLHRNFQGYSAHAECDLVAMGVSAISNIGDNYYQSTTKLDEYHEQIIEGVLPITRGYELEPDDILRRDVIQELMCHFQLDMQKFERFWNIGFPSYFEKELDELKQTERDGLVSIQDNIIEIQPSGRFLIRNICMVFDRYLETTDTQTTFSKAL